MYIMAANIVVLIFRSTQPKLTNILSSFRSTQPKLVDLLNILSFNENYTSEV